jgi:hypothetical protein
MERMTVEDLRRSMKLLSLRMSDDRLRVVAPILNLNMEALQLLTKDQLPKELEPTTYLAEIEKMSKVKRSATI